MWKQCCDLQTGDASLQDLIEKQKGLWSWDEMILSATEELRATARDVRAGAWDEIHSTFLSSTYGFVLVIKPHIDCCRLFGAFLR